MSLAVVATVIENESASKFFFLRSRIASFTYKMTSIWAIVRPFVSGRKKKDQVLATNIHEAKKNQVP